MYGQVPGTMQSDTLPSETGGRRRTGEAWVEDAGAKFLVPVWGQAKLVVAGYSVISRGVQDRDTHQTELSAFVNLTSMHNRRRAPTLAYSAHWRAV